MGCGDEKTPGEQERKKKRGREREPIIQRREHVQGGKESKGPPAPTRPQRDRGGGHGAGSTHAHTHSLSPSLSLSQDTPTARGRESALVALAYDRDRRLLLLILFCHRAVSQGKAALLNLPSCLSTLPEGFVSAFVHAGAGGAGIQLANGPNALESDRLTVPAVLYECSAVLVRTHGEFCISVVRNKSTHNTAVEQVFQ